MLFINWTLCQICLFEFIWVEGAWSWWNILRGFASYRSLGTSDVSSSEPGSSVSIVSSYGLDDRVIEVRSPARAKDFSSSLCVQTGSGAHPAGRKARPGRDADHSPPSSAEVENG
jgi:hypothetical protein